MSRPGQRSSNLLISLAKSYGRDLKHWFGGLTTRYAAGAGLLAAGVVLLLVAAGVAIYAWWDELVPRGRPALLRGNPTRLQDQRVPGFSLPGLVGPGFEARDLLTARKPIVVKFWVIGSNRNMPAKVPANTAPSGVCAKLKTMPLPSAPGSSGLGRQPPITPRCRSRMSIPFSRVPNQISPLASSKMLLMLGLDKLAGRAGL